VGGALALDSGRLLSWSNDNTLRLWDADTGAALAVFAGVADWSRADPALAAELARHRPSNRALHHSLHLGYVIQEAKDDLAVFSGGRHLRFCRFIPSRVEASS
jgi:WD40 repeat protein